MPHQDRPGNPTTDRLLAKAQAMSHMGCWAFEVDGGDITWTDQLFDIFGLPVGCPPAFEEQEELFTAASWRALVLRVTAAQELGRSYDVILEIIRPDGEHRWTRARGACERDDHEQITHLYGTFQDVTDQHDRQRELERRQAALLRSNQALSEFAFAASHDLQEPLRAVAGCAQILERRYAHQFDEGGRELVGHMVDGAVRMKALLGDLLTFSRIGTAKEPFAVHDLTPIIEQAWEDELRRNGVQHAALELDGSARTLGNLSELRLLFEHLLSNALKYRSAASPRVRVSLVPGPDRIRVAVHDNGIGIEPRFREQVFEVFKRLHTREHSAGTGIGLALCRRVVEHHGGTISLDPAITHGVRVRLDLPSAKEERHA